MVVKYFYFLFNDETVLLGGASLTRIRHEN